MTTLVFGAAGYLGSALTASLPNSVATSADITDPAAVREVLRQHQPAVVVNAAGKTGRPNVDWCESHREETVRANILGPLVLLDACHKQDCYFVQLSSGCLYQGDRAGEGYRESDPANFEGSFYARSKAHIDRILSDFPVLQLRPRMPFDNTLHPRSLLAKLIRYDRVLDAPNSFTYLPDFLKAAGTLIERRETGVFHVVNPGVSSPYKMLQQYRDRVDTSLRFQRITPDQLSEVTTAPRSNCVLSTEKLEGLGIRLQPIESAMEEAFDALASNSA